MKKGQWIATQVIGMSDITLTCSNCRDEFTGENDIDTWKSVYHYCPSCGAYMGEDIESKPIPWKLMAETDRSLLYGYGNHQEKNWLFFDKETCRCWGYNERFETYDDDTTTYKTDLSEDATWCDHFANNYSSKYGRGRSYDLVMDLDTIDFISDVLMKINMERNEAENAI